MDTPERFEAALKRLSAALEQLEAASARRIKAEAQRADLEEELSVMQDDRSRLAVELDGALARTLALEAAAAEAARRLAGAGAALRGLVAALEQDS